MDLHAKWRELSGQGQFNVSQRILARGLPQYIGIDSQGRWIFFSMSVIQPDAWQEVGPIEVKLLEAAGSWRLIVTLTDPEFRQEFAYLCEDLVAKASSVDDEADAIRLQKRAFDDWVRFFRSRTKMTDEKARGLFGELFFLRSMIGLGRAPEEAIEAWVGPMGAPQDFVFDGFRAVEVKTLMPQAASVRIANEHQLSFPGDLELRVFRLQQLSADGFGETILDVVDQVYSQASEQGKSELYRRLQKVGFDPNLELVRDSRFLIGEVLSFDGNADGFPKLISERLPSGVHEVAYKIALNELVGKGFEVEI